MRMRTHIVAVCLWCICAISSLVAEEGTGLAATYYDAVDFTGATVSRTDPSINFGWPGDTPAPGVIASDFWSAIWVGSIEIPATAAYTFTTVSDDGIVLLIDGTPIIENWTGHAPTSDVGQLNLTQGRHSIEMRYYNSHGGATLQLWWQSDALAKALVPTAALFPTVPPAVIGTGTGLQGSYYNTGDWTGPALTRIDPGIDFAWGTTAPMAGIRQDVFSVAWRGWIQAQYTQTYTFTAASDDGFGLWIDGKPVIESLEYTPHGELSGALHLVGGRRYEILVKHRQMLGTAFAHLRWSCPLTPRQVFPASQLYAYDDDAARAVAITSPAETYVSPGWITGQRGARSTAVTAMVNGQPVAAQADADGSWFLTTDPAQRSAPGVPLHPGANQVVVTGTSTGGSASESQTVTWQTLPINDLPYGLDRIVCRVGDRILATVSGPGAACVLTLSGPSGVVGTWTATPGQSVEIAMPATGSYTLSGQRDGHPAGSLSVVVVGVDLQGPIACEQDFQRIKDVTMSVSDPSDICFTASDEGQMDVTRGSQLNGVQRLNLRPKAIDTLALQARILDAHGPIVAWCPVDVFSQRTSAESTIDIIEQLPDGSLLTQAVLTMTPLVRGLDVRLSMYTGGAVFIDGSTRMDVSTGLYSPGPGGVGRYTYQIIRSPRPGSALCHTTQTYQAGVLVGNH